MYNVTFKQYLDSEILTFHDKLINDEDDSDKRKVVPTTGEICPRNRIVEWCPFTNDYEIMYNIHDDDSSVKRSMRRTKQIIYDIAQSNDWEYFFTLTFNPKKVDSFNYADCAKSLSVWLNNMRKKCDLKYIVVPEQHKSGRWHFHGLFMSCDELGFVDSGLKADKGQIIYNVGRYRLGWSTAIRLDGSKAVCTYLTKYITKELCKLTKGKKKYWASRNVDKPIVKKFLLEGSEREFMELFDVEGREVISENAYGKTIYMTMPIYTTNTMRFNTSEDEVFLPYIELKNTESNEDNE